MLMHYTEIWCISDGTLLVFANGLLCRRFYSIDINWQNANFRFGRKILNLLISYWKSFDVAELSTYR
jgi:hypothetical protein